MGFASLYLSYGSESLARVTLFEIRIRRAAYALSSLPARTRRGPCPAGHEKTARFVIDLTTSKAVPEAEAVIGAIPCAESAAVIANGIRFSRRSSVESRRPDVAARTIHS